MTKEIIKQKLTLDRPVTYTIKVPGKIDVSWADGAGSMAITVDSEGAGPPVAILAGNSVTTRPV